MKKLLKLFVLFILAFSANSCSSDSGTSSPHGTLTATIDNVARTFYTVVVNQEEFPADGENPAYTMLTVTASDNNSTAQYFTFSLIKGEIGADAAFAFSYVDNGTTYYDSGAFSNFVQTNSNNKVLEGTFSGTLSDEMSNPGNVETVTITGGSFDIHY
jgi:hypothetical protein